MVKFIFFLHFHKAGGHTINRLFDSARKHQPNVNGNPWKGDQIIEFWNFRKQEFNAFKNELSEKAVQFVAFEWNYFKYFDEIDHGDCRLITCIREPYDRFLSTLNYYKQTDAISFHDQDLYWSEKPGQNFPVIYNKFNYYVKMLNGLGNDHSAEVDETHLQIAKENLRRFATVMILERPFSFYLLQQYGVSRNQVHPGRIQKKNVNRSPKLSGDLSREQFQSANQLDYLLYEYALELYEDQADRYLR